MNNKITKFIIGDKVCVYNCDGRFVGIIIDIHAQDDFYLFEIDFGATHSLFAHEKQCRKLIKKVDNNIINDIGGVTANIKKLSYEIKVKE